MERHSTRLTKQFFNGSIEIRFPDELHCIAFVQGCHWEEKGKGQEDGEGRKERGEEIIADIAACVRGLAWLGREVEPCEF